MAGKGGRRHVGDTDLEAELRFIYLTAVFAAAICFTATPAGATSGNHHRALQAESHQLQRLYHARGYLRAIGRVAHRTIYSSNPAVRSRWRRDAHWLAHVRDDAAHKLYAMRHPNLARQSSFPPHHALWMCIHGNEGAWDDPNSGGNGHYGGLQMTPGWERMFSGTANNYSQAQQEWFAENAWKENGYSTAFLYGQWFDYDGAAGACLQYA